MRCCSHLEGSTKPELKHRPIETKIKNRKQSQKKNTMNTWAENFQLEPSQKAQKHTSFLPPHVCLAWKRLAKAFATVIPQTVHHASYLPSVHKKKQVSICWKWAFFFVPKKRSRLVFQPSFFRGFCCWFQRECCEGPLSAMFTTFTNFTTQTHKTHTINLHLVTPQSPPSPLPSLESLEDSQTLHGPTNEPPTRTNKRFTLSETNGTNAPENSNAWKIFISCKKVPFCLFSWGKVHVTFQG